MRTRALLIPWVVAALAVFIVAFVISPVRTLPKADAAGPPSPSLIPVATNPAEEQVPTTFHTEQRQPLQAPVELRSANRQLRTAGAKVKGYAYQGNYIGPTLRVHPGDTVRIDLTNRLGEPTNLHGHGCSCHRWHL